MPEQVETSKKKITVTFALEEIERQIIGQGLLLAELLAAPSPVRAPRP